MSFNDFYKRFTAFGLAFALGLFAAAYFYGFSFSGIFTKESEPATKAVSSTNYGEGIGSSNHRSNFNSETDKITTKAPQGKTEGVRIISKPLLSNNISGRFNEERLKLLSGKKVVLRVVFSANGEIGAISVISGLPEGLTEEAIAAAKKIKFEPAMKRGKAVTVTRKVEYTFTIY